MLPSAQTFAFTGRKYIWWKPTSNSLLTFAYDHPMGFVEPRPNYPTSWLAEKMFQVVSYSSTLLIVGTAEA